jgi:hypothetical protein
MASAILQSQAKSWMAECLCMTPSARKATDEGKPQRAESRATVVAAVIGALSGLLGALVGAGASYVATAQQLDRQDRANAAEARRAATEVHRAACVATLQSMDRNRGALVGLDAAVSVPGDTNVVSRANDLDAASASYRETLAAIYLSASEKEIASAQAFIDETGKAETALLKAAQAGTPASVVRDLIATAGKSQDAAENIQRTFAAQCKAIVNSNDQ